MLKVIQIIASFPTITLEGYTLILIRLILLKTFLSRYFILIKIILFNVTKLLIQQLATNSYHFTSKKQAFAIIEDIKKDLLQQLLHGNKLLDFFALMKLLAT